jgi:hypothetical protein
MLLKRLFAPLLFAPSLALAQNNFARTDAFADAAPASAEQSVPALAAYLSRSGRDDLTRSRAVYRWITHHIDYDATGFRSGNYGDLTPEGVLHRRAAVCDGYSHLYQALGVAMGLQVEVVSGWSKGYSYAPGLRLDGRPNHSWNAVRIDGRWRLLDATWGSGYLDERLRFFRDFQEHYFLTSPDAFVFDHFPAESRWQLVDRPLSMEEFTDLVYLRPMFFQAGFRIVSHSHARIMADDRLTVTLGVTQPVDISAQLVDPRTDKPVSGELAFAQVDETHAEISAAFPRSGEYVLRVFAKPRGADGPLGWVLDYRVDASRGTRDAAFPVPYSGFETSHAWLFESLDGTLHPGQTYRFRVRVPGASEVMMDNAGRRMLLARNGDEYSAELVAGRGESVLYAKFGAGDDYLGLLKYVGK